MSGGPGPGFGAAAAGPLLRRDGGTSAFGMAVQTPAPATAFSKNHKETAMPDPQWSAPAADGGPQDELSQPDPFAADAMQPVQQPGRPWSAPGARPAPAAAATAGPQAEAPRLRGNARPTLMAYPPERYYPPVGGDHDWLREQLAAAVKAAQPGAQEWGLLPTPLTAADADAGRRPAYHVWYRGGGGGFRTATDAGGAPLVVRFRPETARLPLAALPPRASPAASLTPADAAPAGDSEVPVSPQRGGAARAEMPATAAAQNIAQPAPPRPAGKRKRGARPNRAR